MKRLLFSSFYLFIATSGIAQDWAITYNDVIGQFTQPETRNNETILQTYDHDHVDPRLNEGRTIVFSRVEDDIILGNPALKVSLLDVTGNEINIPGAPELISDASFGSSAAELIPRASAILYDGPFGSTNYIVAGYADFGTGFTEIWYVLFDKDLIPIPTNWIPGNPVPPASGLQNYIKRIRRPNENIYITDICTVAGNNPFKFAFTGKTTSGALASTALNIWDAMILYNNNIYILQIDPFNNITDYKEFQTNNNYPTVPSNNRLFPSKIIELNTPNPTSSGFMISGTEWRSQMNLSPDILSNLPTDNSPFFLLRTDYACAAPNSTIHSLRPANGLPFHKLNAQSLRYDDWNGTGRVYVAGVGGYENTNSGTGFEGIAFYDVVNNINSTATNVINAQSATHSFGGPGIPYMYHGLGNFNFNYPNIEEIYENPSGAGFGSARTVVAGRCLEEVYSNTGNMPFLAEVDFNNITNNPNDWLNQSAINAALYPRLVSGGSSPGFHLQDENYYHLQLVNSQQVSKGFWSRATGMQDYYFATIACPTAIGAEQHTAVLAADGNNVYYNSCNYFDNIFQSGSLRMTPATFTFSATLSPTINLPTSMSNHRLTIAENTDCSQEPFRPMEEVERKFKIWSDGNGRIHWQGSNGKIDKLLVYNSLGKVVKEIIGDKLLDYQVSLENYSKGIYFVKAISINKKEQIEVLKLLN